MKAVELFAGAGGLAMGVSLAGFSPEVVVEWDKWACATIRRNQERSFPLVRDWPLWEGDVREFAWQRLAGRNIDLITGGPPCQPFSLAGKHKGHDDKRDMFPALTRVVGALAPKAFVVENVKGLTRPSFANYFEYILLQLEFPEMTCGDGECWRDHWCRLQREKTSGRYSGLRYNIVVKLVNAADYGVPQTRERVFIVGFRDDLGIEWSFPEATHSLDALLRAQWITGEYWERHGVSRVVASRLKERFSSRLARLAREGSKPPTKPWRTVRDALEGLPEPQTDGEGRFFNHKLQEGAKVYPGHTGSPLDLPAKTLKAGDHGVPGGENMMVRDDGSVRYFSAREAARLQTFPDGYVFTGSWSEVMRQLGNAVPVALAARVVGSVAEKLIEREMNRIAAKHGRRVA